MATTEYGALCQVPSGACGGAGRGGWRGWERLRAAEPRLETDSTSKPTTTPTGHEAAAALTGRRQPDLDLGSPMLG